ncbi:GNAT family N-acetyltransferase [Uliginosibacterium paludis]|uniref:GNAT family N-acetyltransferase n=1 Tax=Uliginosibacterium paludis TaxID=1615952 RepID=A0ABV2CS65_9RHOO
MSLFIRVLTDADLPDLLALYRELHPADGATEENVARQVWQQIQATPGLTLLGGFAGEQLAASCMLVLVPNLTRGARPFGLIENVVTSDAFRRRGYGRTLLQHATLLAREAGCYKLMLQTGRLDAATFAFYEACGFSRHAKQAFLMRLE